MTLPQLYSRVTLHSYANIRYGSEARPEGCGSASPLAMGLNGLISRNIAGLVRSFRLKGEWKEYDLEEFAKAGRVPDTSMMLNMVVRAAVEKMERLESFRYSLCLCNGAIPHAKGLQLGAQYEDAPNSVSRFGPTADIDFVSHQLPCTTSASTRDIDSTNPQTPDIEDH